MFFRKKKLIDFLINQLDMYRCNNQQLLVEKNTIERKYNALINNILFNDLLHKIIAFYSKDEYDYIISIVNFQHISDDKFEMDFKLQCLSVGDFLKQATKAKAEIEIQNGFLEIVNIDAYEWHKGFGSKLLNCIESYASANNISKIYGLIYENTPIGKDNLLRFYQKNGYEINSKKTHFFKYIRSPGNERTTL